VTFVYIKYLVTLPKKRRGKTDDGEDDGPSSGERGSTRPPRHFASSVDELFEYSFRDLNPSNMVGILVHNADNQQDKLIGLSFRRSGQISEGRPVQRV